MYNLLRFIKINQFLLLFVLIEGFSVFLLLQNNSYQANTVIKFSTRYTGFIHNYTTLFSDYIALKQTNNYLCTLEILLVVTVRWSSDFFFHPKPISESTKQKQNAIIFRRKTDEN